MNDSSVPTLDNDTSRHVLQMINTSINCHGVGGNNRFQLVQSLLGFLTRDNTNDSMINRHREWMARYDQRCSFTNLSLREAVNLFFEQPDACFARFGPIRFWNTVNVTDMSELFYKRSTLNRLEYI